MEQNSVGKWLNVTYAVTLPHACCAKICQKAKTPYEARQLAKRSIVKGIVPLKFTNSPEVIKGTAEV